MHRSIRQARAAVLAVAVALALALGAVGCGDSDDDNEGGGGQGSAADTGGGGSQASGGGDGGSGASADSGGHTGREAEINEVLVGIQDDFVEVDGASYCDRLTAAGKRQVEGFGKTLGYGNACVKVINTVAKNTRDAGVEQKPTKLISVKFKGDRAVATIRNGRRPRESMVFVNEQGAWKIPDPGFGNELGGSSSKQLEADPAERFRQVFRARQAVKRQSQGQ